MTAGVLEQAPNQVAEQVSHARAMEIIEGAGMVVPQSVDEIQAIVPFTQHFRTGVSANTPWVSRDPVSGEYHSVAPALYDGFIQTARTLGDIDFWRLDPEDTGMRGILNDPTLSHLHDYAQQRESLAEAIRQHDHAQRLTELREELAVRDALHGTDTSFHRFPLEGGAETAVYDPPRLTTPYSAERVIVLPAERSRVATFLSNLVSRVFRQK